MQFQLDQFIGRIGGRSNSQKNVCTLYRVIEGLELLDFLPDKLKQLFVGVEVNRLNVNLHFNLI